MNYTIRQIKESEYGILIDFLYEAIFIPEGVEAPPREIINQPELQVYITDFGKQKGDFCFVAEADEKILKTHDPIDDRPDVKVSDDEKEDEKEDKKKDKEK